MAPRARGPRVAGILGIVGASLVGGPVLGARDPACSRPGPGAPDTVLTFDASGAARVLPRGGRRRVPDGSLVEVRLPAATDALRARRRANALGAEARRLYGPARAWRVVSAGGGRLSDQARVAAVRAIRSGDPRAVVAALGCTGAGSTPPAGRTRFGVAVGSSLAYLAPVELGRRMDGIAALGAGRVRFDVSWATVQRAGPRAYDWAPFDAIVSAARTRDLEALAVLAYPPRWATRAGDAGAEGARPADTAAFARFAGAAARHLGPLGVHDFEIWNEPNAGFFWRDPDPADYTPFLIAAATVIADVDPQARVVTGGLAPASDVPGFRAPVGFLEGIYAAGGKGAFDAVGHHPYTYPERPSGTHPLNAWFQMANAPLSLRSVMAANGDAGKEIWPTEFGAPTGGPVGTRVTEAEQALQLREAYSLAGAAPWAGPVFWYEYRDGGADRSAESFFGLERANGSRKPAFAAYRTLTAARGRR